MIDMGDKSVALVAAKAVLDVHVAYVKKRLEFAVTGTECEEIMKDSKRFIANLNKELWMNKNE